MSLFSSGDQSLTIVLKARDEFSDTLESVGKNLKTLQPTFQRMAAAGTVAFGGIAVAAKKSLDAYQENQTANVRLAQLLKTSRGASDAQVKTLFDQADALERVGVVSADVIKTGQGTFATFDLQADSIKKLTPAFLDMVVSERGVNATTDDMISFADSLGQALQGNFASLAKRGFVLDDNTKKMIENGDESDRVDAIVKVLSSTYDGMNEAQRKTSAGMDKGLTMSLNNMEQAIGKGLAPALQTLAEKLTPVAQGIADWIDNHPDLAANILLIAGAVAGLAAFVGLLGLALPVVIAGFTLLMGPVGIIIGILGALIGTVTAVTLIFDDLFNHTGEVWAGIKEYFKEGVNFLIGIAEGWANDWVKAVNVIIGALNKIHFSIPDWVPGVGGKSFGINIPLAKEIELPRFEFGGIVPGARGQAVPIMAHGGERVIPAGRAGIGGGDTYSIVINNPVISSREDAANLRRQLEQALRDVSRGHKLRTI
jgi:hypothetical protein